MNQVLSPAASTQPQQQVNLGEHLRSVRLQRGLTLEDIAQRTFIKRHYLEALEAGQFQSLPAPVYTSGYIRQYARMLGLDETALIQQYHLQRQFQTHEPPVGRGDNQPQFAPVLSQQDGRVTIETIQVPPPPPTSPNKEMEKNMNPNPNASSNAMSPVSPVSDSVDGSRKEALAMRYQTEQFAEQVLLHLEDEIQKTLTIIQNGRAYLQQRLSHYQY